MNEVPLKNKWIRLPLPAKAIYLFVAFITLIITCPSTLRAADKAFTSIPMLTIGISTRQEKVKIWGTKGFRVKDPVADSNLFARKKATPLIISVHMKGFMIDGFGVKSRVLIEPLKDSLLYIDGKAYRGSFMVEEDRFGKITVINIIDVEKYLYGVIKSEMLISSPMEALKAQAVIARTFAIKHKDKFVESRGYGLTDDTSSQVYTGVAGEDPRGTKAVDDTKGLCLTYGGALIQCYYHACCGGWTINNEDAWGGGALPYLRSRKCGYCADSHSFQWDLKLPYTTIIENLLEAGNSLGRIESIKAIRDKESGRALVLIIENEKGQLRILGNMFRLAVGPSIVKSSFFDIEESQHNGMPQLASSEISDNSQQGELKMEEMIGNYLNAINTPGELKIHGSGSGHGVGLCQSGARGQAELHKSFREILEFYYKNTKVKDFY
jgi:stage II sporulation protein D